MSDPAIPPNLEGEVYDLASKGWSSRQIKTFLFNKRDCSASHSAVLTCLRRMAQEQREVDESILAESGAIPSDLSDEDPEDRLARLDRDLEVVARRARLEKNTEVALKTRLAQFRVTERRLKHREHNERLVCRYRLKNVSVNLVQNSPSNTLPETLPNDATH